MTTALASSTNDYELHAQRELQHWRERMLRQPGIFGWAAARVQAKINTYIPEKMHAAITATIKQMTQAMLFGSEVVAPQPLLDASLETRERMAREKIETYTRTASVEGGIAGAGGFVLGLVDFPVLLGIKLKLLFDLAAVYGYSAAHLAERLYLLQIFQLAFSSQQHRRKIFLEIENWQTTSQQISPSLDNFDWRTYQQEYRNHIDLAKLAQLIPVIGAPVGAIVNFGLLKHLGETAMNAYRLRWFAGFERQSEDLKTSDPTSPSDKNEAARLRI